MADRPDIIQPRREPDSAAYVSGCARGRENAAREALQWLADRGYHDLGNALAAHLRGQD